MALASPYSELKSSISNEYNIDRVLITYKGLKYKILNDKFSSLDGVQGNITAENFGIFRDSLKTISLA